MNTELLSARDLELIVLMAAEQKSADEIGSPARFGRANADQPAQFIPHDETLHLLRATDKSLLRELAERIYHARTLNGQKIRDVGDMAVWLIELSHGVPLGPRPAPEPKPVAVPAEYQETTR